MAGGRREGAGRKPGEQSVVRRIPLGCLADVDAVIAGYRKKRGKDGGLKPVTEVNGGLGVVAQQAAVPPVLPCQPLADPLGATLITVPVDQIDQCDLNPRIQPNKAFLAIKNSIRAVGLDNPIPVTRLPGSERFMVAGGGNTRLKALVELAQEERETLKPGEKPRFAEAACIFKPYTSDIDILVAALRENGLRGERVSVGFGSQSDGKPGDAPVG